MSNMGYCRFQNTLNDLRDCFEHIDDDMRDDEDRARKKLIRLCKSIAESFEEEDLES